MSQLSGLATSTRRYYEEKGLIKPIGRKDLKRIYHGKDVITRLLWISLGQQVKFTLDEITTMLNHQDGPNIEWVSLIAKAEQIETTTQNLAASKDGIIHIANCPEKNHILCPNFQKIMHTSLKLKRIKNKQF